MYYKTVDHKIMQQMGANNTKHCVMGRLRLWTSGHHAERISCFVYKFVKLQDNCTYVGNKSAYVSTFIPCKCNIFY